MVGKGFDFTLLPSHCVFSFVFGRGVSFLVGSSIFLLMVGQQLVAILVHSQEDMSTHPYSAILSQSPSCIFFRKVLEEVLYISLYI